MSQEDVLYRGGSSNESTDDVWKGIILAAILSAMILLTLAMLGAMLL